MAGFDLRAAQKKADKAAKELAEKIGPAKHIPGFEPSQETRDFIKRLKNLEHLKHW